MGNYESADDPPSAYSSVQHEEGEDKNGAHHDEEAPFSRTLSQKVLVKVYVILVRTTDPIQSESKIKLSAESINTVSATTTVPTQKTHSFSLRLKVDVESLTRLFENKMCIIDEIVLDYTENDYPFNMDLIIKNLVAEYNLPKFVNDAIIKTTGNNIALPNILLSEKQYKAFTALRLTLPKEYQGSAKRLVIYRLFEDAQVRKEILGMVQRNFSIVQFFTKIQRTDTSVILLSNDPMTINLLKWGVLEVPTLTHEDRRPFNPSKSTAVPTLISNFSDCIIPKSQISVLTNVRVAGQDEAHAFAFKINSSTYFGAINNLCQKMGLTKLVPMQRIDEFTFELGLSADQEQCILERLVEVSKFNESTSTKSELCNFLLDIKLLY
jgi:hypothetical protein